MRSFGVTLRATAAFRIRAPSTCTGMLCLSAFAFSWNISCFATNSQQNTCKVHFMVFDQRLQVKVTENDVMTFNNIVIALKFFQSLAVNVLFLGELNWLHTVVAYSYLSQKVDWNNLPTVVVMCVFHHNQSGTWLMGVVFRADALIEYVKVKCTIRLVWNCTWMKPTNLMQHSKSWVKQEYPKPNTLLHPYPQTELLKHVVEVPLTVGTKYYKHNCNLKML